MKTRKRSLATLVVLMGAGVAGYFWILPIQHELHPTLDTKDLLVHDMAAPSVHYPVPTEAHNPIPSIDSSDPSLVKALSDLFGQK